MSRGAGTFVLVLGGSREARASLLGVVEQNAASSGWETLRLRAHPLDAMVPYGALQPWLSRWYHPTEDAGAPSHDGSRRPHSETFAMPLVGLIAGLPSRAPHEREHGGGGSRSTLADRSDEVRAFTPAELRAELVDLVQGRTRQNPAVVLIEDADFLDAASRDWFSFLALRMTDMPLAVAIALEGEAEETEFWRQNLAEAPAAWCPLPMDPLGASGEERLRSRLRALPPRTLEALSLAVVAGPDADRTTLKEVLGMTDKELNLALSPAIDAGLLRLDGDRYDCPEPALFPDLLGSVRSAQLVGLHRNLAQALTKRPAHQQQGKALFRLSDHWAEAGEIGRGVPALLAASKEAERWGAPELAEQRLLRAVVLSQTDPTARGRETEEKVYAEIAKLRLRANRPVEAREAFQRAMALAKERGARALQWARYVSGIADAEVRLGGHPDELLRSTLAQVQGRSNELEALLLRSLSYYYLERARFDESIAAAERASELAEKGPDAVLKVRCHNSAASSYIFSGLEPERARAHLLKALEERPRLEGTSDQLILVNIMDGLSLLECSLGRESEAVRWGEEAITTARRYGYGSTLLLVLGNTPEHYVHTREFAKAKALTDELRRLVDRLGLPERDNNRQQLYLLEGRIAAETNDVATARARFEGMVAMSEKGGSRVFLGQALVHLVVLSARHHDLEAARRYYHRLEKEGVMRSLMGENRRLLEQVEPLLRSENDSPHPG